jgi:Holliday junction resolvasome RuvABC endonuclease subunit
MEQRDPNAVYVDQTRILFLDPSSSCTGFAMVSVDYGRKTAEIVSAGPLWFGSDWKEGKKLRYIFSAIRNYFFILNQGVSEVVCEEYFFPMGPHAKVQGSMIVPEMIGVITLAAADEEPPLDFTKYSAQAWRKLLEIKPDTSPMLDKLGKPVLTKRGVAKKVKDFKTPVARLVKTYFTVPDEFESNITGNARQTPNDVTDVLGMVIGVLQKRGIKTFTAQPNWDKKHLCVKELVE